MMVLLMPSWGVGSGGAVGVKVGVQAGFGVMLGVGDAVAVGVWLGVRVGVAVAVAVEVAVSAMVGVGATVLRALLSLSRVGVLAMATAVSPSRCSFNTAPAKTSSSTNSKNEPTKLPLRPLA